MIPPSIHSPTSKLSISTLMTILRCSWFSVVRFLRFLPHAIIGVLPQGPLSVSTSSCLSFFPSSFPLLPYLFVPLPPPSLFFQYPLYFPLYLFPYSLSRPPLLFFSFSLYNIPFVLLFFSHLIIFLSLFSCCFSNLSFILLSLNLCKLPLTPFLLPICYHLSSPTTFRLSLLFFKCYFLFLFIFSATLSCRLLLLASLIRFPFFPNSSSLYSLFLPWTHHSYLSLPFILPSFSTSLICFFFLAPTSSTLLCLYIYRSTFIFLLTSLLFASDQTTYYPLFFLSFLSPLHTFHFSPFLLSFHLSSFYFLYHSLRIFFLSTSGSTSAFYLAFSLSSYSLPLHKISLSSPSSLSTSLVFVSASPPPPSERDQVYLGSLNFGNSPSVSSASLFSFIKLPYR